MRWSRSQVAAIALRSKRASCSACRSTGQKHRAPESWKAWWKTARELFAFADGTSSLKRSDDEITVAYHGINLDSDHAAFLIDGSEEMKSTLKSKQTIKAQAARDELEGVMKKLGEKMKFSLFTYAENVRAFDEKGPVELTPRSMKKALEFLDDVVPGKSKDIWKALELVIVDPTLDTAFLLSSGEPDIGLYVHWNRVTWHLKELNRFQKVVVHTIAFSDNDWYRQQIEKIAEATGGEYRWFE